MDNLLEKEFKKWQDQQLRFETEKLFSSKALNSPEFLKVKLEYLERLLIRMPVQSELESATARLVKVEMKGIERELYPIWWQRTLATLLKTFRQKDAVKEFDNLKQSSSERAVATLHRAGFSNYVQVIAEKMKQEKEFSFPVSYYVNEKERMDLELYFRKDAHNNLRFESFKATPTSGGASEQKQHHFSQADLKSFNQHRAYELLSGRAVRTHHAGGAWQSFDLNDKDAEGNFRIKTFVDYYNKFDLESAFKKLPLATDAFMEAGELLRQLENGQRVTLPLQINGERKIFAIEANPQYREIGIYDAYSNKVSIPELVERSQKATQNRQTATKQEDGRSKRQRNRSKGIKVG